MKVELKKATKLDSKRASRTRKYEKFDTKHYKSLSKARKCLTKR
jgi:hypothetical protein